MAELFQKIFMKKTKNEIAAETARDNFTTHGMTGRPIHAVWKTMRQRCLNPNSQKYHYYGGRGIKICDRWDSFENFFLDMAPTWQQGLKLERVNNNGNYEPTNCCWTTHTTQMRNTRKTKLTIEIAREIRKCYATGDFSHRILGNAYGVDKSIIGDIINNKIWKEIV